MDEYQPGIQKWADQGLLTPDAILNSLSANIKRFGLLNDDYQQRLHKTFDSLCDKEQNGTRYLSKSAMTSFLQNTGFLPQSTAEEAAILLHHSLLYLARAPFHQPREESSLTEDGLLRALVWVEYDRSRRLYEESEDCRTRTPADTRRIIFQSLAGRITSQDIDTHKARKEAEYNAFDFPSFYAHRTQFAVTNYDDDGDEMFHDVLDALFAAQPVTPIWIGNVPRESFRPWARKLHPAESSCPVRHLSIPVDELRVVVKVALLAHFAPLCVEERQLVDLDHVVDCMMRSFTRNSDAEDITWEMFNQVLRTTPSLFDGLNNILASFYTTPNNVKSLPPPRKIASIPILIQLSTILSDPISFADLHFYKAYAPHTISITALALAEIISATSDSVILLLSGKSTTTDEKTTFAYFIPWANATDCNMCLFQLSPVHRVFERNGDRPGWAIDQDEKMVIGERGNGAGLVMNADLKHAVFYHSASGQKKSGYKTAWSGDWQEEMDVEDIEIWIGN